MKHYRIVNRKYHNEGTALERSVINYLGLKLALQDPDSRSQLPRGKTCLVRVDVFNLSLNH